MSRFTYTITAIPTRLGGGWVLKLFEDHQHTGGGYYPSPNPYTHVVDVWWRELSEEAKLVWLHRGGTHDSTGAYHAYMLAKTFEQAEEDGKAWARSRSAISGGESA